MARKKQAQQQDDDGDWRAELAKAKQAKEADKADWRSGKEGGRPDDQKADYGVQDHTQLLAPSPDPGPENEGEEMKRRQSVPDGLRTSSVRSTLPLTRCSTSTVRKSCRRPVSSPGRSATRASPAARR